MVAARIYETVRKFDVGEIIELYKIDLTKQGGVIYYMTNNVMQERIPIHFGGVEYAYMPLSMEDIEVDAQAAPPQPRLSIATSGGPVTAIIEDNNQLRGAEVTQFFTFAEFLDLKPDGSGGTMANPTADGTAIVQSELFIIDRLEGSDNREAQFLCVAPTDIEGAMIPRRIVRKRWCDAMYRVYNALTDTFSTFEPLDGGCPYRGTAYFDRYNNATTKANDQCSKTIQGCLRRYGYLNDAGNWVSNVAMPAQMFPGVRATQEA